MKVTGINSNFCFNASETSSNKLSFCVDKVMLLSFVSLSDTLALGQTCKSLKESVKQSLPKVLNQSAIQLKSAVSKILTSSKKRTPEELRLGVQKILINFLEELEKRPDLYIKFHEFLANKNPLTIEATIFNPLLMALREVEIALKDPCGGYVELSHPKLKSLFFHMSCGSSSSVVDQWYNSLPLDDLSQLTSIYLELAEMESFYDGGFRSEFDMIANPSESPSEFEDQMSVIKMMPGVEKVNVKGYLSHNDFKRLKATEKIIDARKTQFYSKKFWTQKIKRNLFETWLFSSAVGFNVFVLLTKISDLFLLPIVIQAYLLKKISVDLAVLFVLLFSIPLYGLLLTLAVVAIASKIFCTFLRYHKPIQTQLIRV